MAPRLFYSIFAKSLNSAVSEINDFKAIVEYFEEKYNIVHYFLSFCARKDFLYIFFILSPSRIQKKHCRVCMTKSSSVTQEIFNLIKNGDFTPFTCCYHLENATFIFQLFLLLIFKRKMKSFDGFKISLYIREYKGQKW